jgi:hypothetical protein
MVVNATFNNILVVSWRSVLLVEQTGIPTENRHLLQVTVGSSIIEKITCKQILSPADARMSLYNN